MKLQLIFLWLCTCLTSAAQNKGIDILYKINKNEKPSWDATMKAFSFTAYPVGALTPLSILAHGYVQKNQQLIRNGYRSVATIGLAMGLSTVMKYSFQRPRPFDTWPGHIVARDHVSTWSFPSGHSTAAFASATSLTLTYRKWYVAVPAYTYAGLMGYSRMRLGVHYPGDVMAGAAIGSGAALLIWWLDKKIFRKQTTARTPPETP